MRTEATPSWCQVKLFQGLHADMDADLLVALLAGNGLTARRLPPQQPLSALVAKFPGVIPVTVWVPPEEEEEALELAAEQPQLDVPPPVRSLAGWTIAAMWGTSLLGALLMFWPSTWVRMPVGWLELILAAFWARALVRLIGWLQDQRCFLPDRKVLGASVVLFAVLSIPVALIAGGLAALPRAQLQPHHNLSPELHGLVALVCGLMLIVLAFFLGHTRRRRPLLARRRQR